MSIQAISTVEPRQKKNHYGLSAVAGGALGAVSRYVLPSKAEMKNADTFFSSAAMNARGAKRSILKYGAAGALIAFGINFLTKTLSGEKNTTQGKVEEYSKYNAILDAPGYSCQILWQEV